MFGKFEKLNKRPNSAQYWQIKYQIGRVNDSKVW